MGFTCDNELEIEGGSAEERQAAADLALALDSVDEDSATRREAEPAEAGASGRGKTLVLRFRSVDGLPEEGIAALASQFPGLDFTLAYYSRDGKFFGYGRSGASGEEAASEDIADEGESGTPPPLFERFGGDGIAFVRDRFSLDRRGGGL